MTKLSDQQAESPSRAVTSTSRRPGTSAAERKRQQRERERGQPLVYETEDWRLFTDLATLPQKAGCQPAYLGEIILKELVDNALDAGANVSLSHVGLGRRELPRARSCTGPQNHGPVQRRRLEAGRIYPSTHVPRGERLPMAENRQDSIWTRAAQKRTVNSAGALAAIDPSLPFRVLLWLRRSDTHFAGANAGSRPRW